MKIKKLDLPKPAIDFLLSEGFSKLYPPQADCVDAGLLDGKSILVSAPTASGKTLTAILAMISYLSKNNGKVIYLSPLRALASEKFTEFKKLEKVELGKKIKVGISTGDFENIEKNLEKNNVLVLTNEKMDSIIRHGTEWLDDIGLVIADEIHLIGDESRGPTLEMILTKLKLLESKPQIVGLSATITNANELANWLDCILVKNDWRPVPLSEGVYDGGEVIMNNGNKFEVEPSIRGIPIDLGVQSVKNGGQSLVFAETRTRSKALATKAADVISQFLEKKESEELEKISKKILSDNEHTEWVKTLAILIKKGVAFHHAGLNQNCRQTIETEFRKGTIKLLSSTPTLAAGVNLPARRVVISNINRYNAKVGGNRPISILEYKQLCGRAGRPQYDNYGESIIVGNGNSEDLMEYYIHGEPEPIISKITDDKSLRTHVLSVIVTSPGIKKEEILHRARCRVRLLLPGRPRRPARGGRGAVSFDALHAEHRPPVDGVFIGGGFPETHMEALAANASLRRELHDAIEGGMPAYAECGGLMYLARGIEWNGRRAEMAGVIPADIVMHCRPFGRGYVHLREAGRGLWPRPPAPLIHAHEFHYSSVENLAPDVEFAYEVERGHGIDGAHRDRDRTGARGDRPVVGDAARRS